MPLQSTITVPPIQPGYFLSTKSNGSSPRHSYLRQRSSTSPLATSFADRQQQQQLQQHSHQPLSGRPPPLQPRPVASRRSSQSSDSLTLSSSGHTVGSAKAVTTFRPQLAAVRSTSQLHRSSSSATLREMSNEFITDGDFGELQTASASSLSHAPHSQGHDRESGTTTSSSWYYSIAPSIASPASTSEAILETASEGASSACSAHHRKSTSLGHSLDKANVVAFPGPAAVAADQQHSSVSSKAKALPPATESDAVESLLSSSRSSTSIGYAASTVTDILSEPSLDWGAHFWVVIEDPKTQHLLFYNPSKGECRWTVPKGTFVLPRDPEGDWLQFHDESRQLPYYWHPPSRRAQWERPRSARLIIPLIALQRLSASYPNSIADINHDVSQSPTKRTSTTSYMTSPPTTPEILSSPLSSFAMMSRTRSYNDFRAKMHLQPEEQLPTHHIVPPLSPVLFRRRAATATAEADTPLTSRVNSSSSGADLSYKGFRRAQQPDSSTQSSKLGALSAEDSGVVLLADIPTPSPNTACTIAESSQGEGPPSRNNRIMKHVNGSSSTVREGQEVPPPRAQDSNRRRSSGVAVAPVGSLLTIPQPPIFTAHSVKGSHPQCEARVSSIEISTVSSHGELKALTLMRRPRDPDKRLKVSDFITHSLSPLPNEKKSTESPHKQDSLSTAAQLGVESPGLQRFEFFARERFFPKRRGLFKRKVNPMEPLRWQMNRLASPLLPLPRDLHHDAVLCSKVILRLCGERDKAVFIGKPPPVSIGFTPGVGNMPVQPHSDIFPMNLSRFRCGQKRAFYQRRTAHAQEAGVSAATIWQEQRWLLETCICKSAIRDEVFCQLISRLSKQAPPTTRFRAWQFLGVLLTSIAPTSRELAESLQVFVDRSCDVEEEHSSILTLARHCQNRLSAVMQRGTSVLAPSIAEIQGSWEAAFNPSVFGQTLEGVMKAQSASYPDMVVPVILYFLGDALFLLGGPSAPGMFRIGGNVQKQIDLRLRIDRGQYSLAGLIDGRHDVLVIGSVLKTFFKELAEPLVPMNFYHSCVEAAALEDVNACTSLVNTTSAMPTLNRRVLLYLVALLQRFSRPEVVKCTGVNSVALASIFSPTIFRSPSTDIAAISRDARFESVWLHTLLLHLPCDNVDPDYSPNVVEPCKRLSQLNSAGATSIASTGTVITGHQSDLRLPFDHL